MNSKELVSITGAINVQIAELDKIARKQFKTVCKALDKGTAEEIEGAIYEHDKTECKIWGLREALWIILHSEEEE